MKVCIAFAPGRDRVDARTRRWGPGEYFFLVVAMACLGLYGYSYFARVLYQTYESWSFDRTLDRSASVVAGSNVEASPVGSVANAPGEPMRLAESKIKEFKINTSIIGRLSVPRLNLSAMVREGIDRKTLKLAVGHIPSTALPGQTGNVGVAGHRDTFFRGLKDVKSRDTIQFSTSTGVFTYEVESLTVVEPDNVGVLEPLHGNFLTLVTCYPFSYIGDAPKRFIVRARQVSPQTQSISIVE
jgi:LPXTG-site transpeptidase (sortase) family protein